jgi:hypothetical protein
MPRADRLSLTSDGLAMPGVDHLSNKGTLNVLLDRILSGLPSGLPPDRTMVGLFMNFSRLTDKALRELMPPGLNCYFMCHRHRANSALVPTCVRLTHMENCVSATHRAVLNARALRANRIGRAAPRLTPLQEQRLAHLRNAVEHSDEKLLGKQKFKNSPPFAEVDPYSLRLANTSMVIGKQVLTYKDLVSAPTMGSPHD